MINELLVITTGGTIDKVYFDANSHYEVGDPVVVPILNSMNLKMVIAQKEICRKDSLDMTDEDREQIRQAVLNSSATHILITHGTDTMAKTATALSDIPNKVIVFTGAMQPAAFHHTDAIFNLGTAMGALSCANSGIYVAMNGQVFPAQSVFKNYQTRRFEST